MQQIGEQAGQEYKELQGQLKKMYDEQITANRDNGWPNSTFPSSQGGVTELTEAKTAPSIISTALVL